MFADTRDTAFQGDPFLKVNENKFYSAKEGVRISSDSWNTDWIKDCFGRSMISKIGHNEIVCSGILLLILYHNWAALTKYQIKFAHAFRPRLFFFLTKFEL